MFLRRRKTTYVFDQDGIARVEGTDEVRRVLWKRLIEISVATRPIGLMRVERTFRFVDEAGEELQVPAGAIEQQWAARRMQRLEGFDLSKLDRAMKNADADLYVLWRAPG